jgi:hypothetical protein
VPASCPHCFFLIQRAIPSRSPLRSRTVESLPSVQRATCEVTCAVLCCAVCYTACQPWPASVQRRDTVDVRREARRSHECRAGHGSGQRRAGVLLWAGLLTSHRALCPCAAWCCGLCGLCVSRRHTHILHTFQHSTQHNTTLTRSRYAVGCRMTEVWTQLTAGLAALGMVSSHRKLMDRCVACSVALIPASRDTFLSYSELHAIHLLAQACNNN